MPFRLELNRTRRQNIAPLEATGDLGISTIKIESNGTYFVEQGDTASIQVSGGGFVTIKAHPGDPVDKITIDFKTRQSPKFAIITFCLIVIRLCFQTGHPAKARIPAKW